MMSMFCHEAAARSALAQKPCETGAIAPLTAFRFLPSSFAEQIIFSALCKHRSVL
jgi:hypothetical protein